MVRSYILAILALVSSALSPFGYMPAMAEDGSFILRICDGTASIPPPAALADADSIHKPHSAGKAPQDHVDAGHEGEGHEGDPHELRCNFAVPSVADLPPTPSFLLRLNEPEARQDVLRTPITGIFPAKLPPATGPPIG